MELKTESKDKLLSMKKTCFEYFQMLYERMFITDEEEEIICEDCYEPKVSLKHVKECKNRISCVYCGSYSHYLIYCEKFYKQDECYVCSKSHVFAVCKKARNIISFLPYCRQCEAIRHLINQCYQRERSSIRLETIISLVSGLRRLRRR